jgi:hypothetical protein
MNTPKIMSKEEVCCKEEKEESLDDRNVHVDVGSEDDIGIIV